MKIDFGGGFDWAAFWAGVQAIGSLLALIVAIGLPLWQRWNDKRALATVVVAIARRALVHVDATVDLVNQLRGAQGNGQTPVTEYLLITEALASAPVYALGNPKALWLTQELRTLVRIAEERAAIVRDLEIRFQPSDYEFKALLAIAATARDRVTILEQALGRPVTAKAPLSPAA